MTLTTTNTIEMTVADPLEVIDQVAQRIGIETHRVDELELHLNLTGSWRDIGLWFAWRPDAQCVQVAAPLEMRVTKGMMVEMLTLLSLVNERLMFGHFELWERDQGIVFRYASVLPENQSLEPGQAEILLRGAIDAFERYYPAFNYVLWGGKTAEEALEAAICETVGSA